VGDIKIANGATFGPVKFSPRRHYGLTAVQFFKWDSAAGRAVASGDVTPLSE
jgi:hypothetical protein